MRTFLSLHITSIFAWNFYLLYWFEIFQNFILIIYFVMLLWLSIESRLEYMSDLLFIFQCLKWIFRQCRTSCPLAGTLCWSLAIRAGLLYMIHYWNLETYWSLWPAENESLKSCRTVTADRRLFHALCSTLKGFCSRAKLTIGMIWRKLQCLISGQSIYFPQ